jgi:uncharacterized membrane protein YvbJ
MKPDICPQCGAVVPERAKACPECGSCEETGWSESAKCDALGIPDESFDYNEFVENEFGAKKSGTQGPSILWKIVAVIVLIAAFFFLF